MRIYSVAETARVLGVAASTIYALCSSKRIRHERIGLGRGTIRIPEDAIEEFRQSVTVEAATGRDSQPVSAPRQKVRPVFKHIRVS
jgi:excisionase family DNA binding protein